MTDALQSTTFRLYSSVAAGTVTETPAALVPRHKVQARHADIYDGSESPKYNFTYHFNFHNCPNRTIVD